MSSVCLHGIKMYKYFLIQVPENVGGKVTNASIRICRLAFLIL